MTNEKRLIDANALIAYFDNQYNVAMDDPDPVSGYVMAALRCCIEHFKTIPTVDAVEVDEVREFAADVAYQFGCYGQYNGRLHIDPGGLSTLEWAFDILGWENPHPVPECECEIDGCHEHATCGAQTDDGYKRMCGRHMRERKDNG